VPEGRMRVCARQDNASAVCHTSGKSPSHTPRSSLPDYFFDLPLAAVFAVAFPALAFAAGAAAFIVSAAAAFPALAGLSAVFVLLLVEGAEKIRSQFWENLADAPVRTIGPLMGGVLIGSIHRNVVVLNNSQCRAQQRFASSHRPCVCQVHPDP
jgi:hypothetical protein